MKQAGSIESVVRGVSQQVPADRRPGQHTEQVNLLPDPVQGLTRRHGSVWQAERLTSIIAAEFAACVADTANYRTYEYTNNGHDFTVMYRYGPRVSGSTMPAIVVYDRTTKTFLDYTRNSFDPLLDQLEANGIAAITAVGKYLFMSANGTPVTGTSTALWDTPTNQQYTVLWVRGGAYKRTFTVTVTETGGTVRTFSYTTPTSNYTGLLDTSKVPPYALDPAGGTISDSEAAYITGGKAELNWADWHPTGLTAKKGTTAMTVITSGTPTDTQVKYVAGDRYAYFSAGNEGATDITLTYTHSKVITNPSYSDIVRDMTNEYNSAVTNWLSTASDAIQPDAIAEQLRIAAVAAGCTGVSRTGSSVLFTNVKTIEVDDGGDKTLIRGVANEVTNIEQMTEIHRIGKVVRVKARNSADSFYLKAESKTGLTSGWGEVTWVEGAGVQHTINNGLFIATADTSAGLMYVASNSTGLSTLYPGTHPTYSASAVGDADSSPQPYFVGRQITYLGMFQDRLLVGCGAVIRASKVGDYLNFYRTSLLTVPADDTVEVLSQGTEEDILRFSVLYDRDLVLFADKRQYVISGRSALTPTAPIMPVMSNHADAALAPPLSVGSMIFYGKVGETGSSVHQIQPGANVESPDSFIVSSQVDTYLTGTIIELANHAKPTHLFMRTTGNPYGLHVFSYLDVTAQQRVQDAWHRWQFGTALGPIFGMQRTSSGLITFHLRAGKTYDGEDKVWFVADLVPLSAGLSSTPYFDSQRPLSQVQANTGSVSMNTSGNWSTAFDNSSQWYLIGSPLSQTATLLAEFPEATGPRVGYAFDSNFVPTNPYIRDKDGKAVTSGRLTITNLLLSFAKSSGFWSYLTKRGSVESKEYNARITDDPYNIVGAEVVTTFQQTLPVGIETREYSLELRSRSWLPFTLTAMDWVGQYFNRTPRA